MGDGDIADGVLAADHKQAAALWELRESITPALTAAGYVYKYDVSLPVPRMYELVEATRARLQDAGYGEDGGVRPVGFGHLGDGNLHLNVSCSAGECSHVHALLEPFVFEWVSEAGGSISAEHGVGQHKCSYLHLAKAVPVIDTMRRLKDVLDPHGILNPYKVLPPK